MVLRINWNEDRTDTEWEELAERFRKESADSYRRSHESFERSDTDGFLSQWASDMTGREYSVAAQLADNHGLVEVDALFDLDGNIASTHRGWSEFGEYWRLNDHASQMYGRRFLNPSKAKDATRRYNNNRKKGFVIGTIRVRGKVANLSGPNAIMLHFGMVPIVSRLQQGDYEIVTTDKHADMLARQES